ncbi:MAG: molybdopterin-dependent oxidoreductase, partial [Chloroflexi bacterium]|nr:molybdopterin-dependent oxidoreductase [Chloroflexota bacterium]
NPFIELEFDKCILCTRCVRVCDEMRGRGVFTMSYRGPDAKIGTAFDLPMFQTDCEFCGACVDVCPTAAIMDRRTKWAGIPAATVRTTCPHCSVGCQLKLEVGQGRVVAARPFSTYPADEGQICARGRYGMEFIHGPDRITAPLVRGPEGLRSASWEEAMGAVVEGLSGRRGAAFAALGGGRLTNEEAYLLQKLARSAMGSNNVDRVGRRQDGADGARTADLMGVAGLSTPQASIGQARSFLVVGADVSEDHPVISVEVIEGVRRRGARLVVAHPRRIELLDLCGFGALHLQYRPGTEAVLLGGMVRLILDEGLEDAAFLDAHCAGLEGLRASLRDGYGLEECARLTGVPAADIAEAARVLAQQRPAAILSGLGLTGPVSDAALQALADLALVTGNYGGPVGGLHVLREAANAQGADDMGLLPHRLPGYRAVDDEAARGHLEGLWGGAPPKEPGRGAAEILAAAGRGEVKALYVVGADPLGEARLGASVEDLEFLVVQDHTLTETARRAHVVLPGATFAEKEGSFTSNERRVQLVRPAIDPPGEALADWRVLCRVAEALGAAGFAYAGPEEVMAEIAAASPLYAGISHSGLAGPGVQWPAGPEAPGGTPCLTPGQLQGGRGRLWALPRPPLADGPDEQYPFMLSLEGWTGRVAGEAVVEVGNGVAASLGLADGASVEVEGRHGRLAARVWFLEELPGGTVRLLQGNPSMLAGGGVRVRKL